MSALALRAATTVRAIITAAIATCTIGGFLLGYATAEHMRHDGAPVQQTGTSQLVQSEPISEDHRIIAQVDTILPDNADSKPHLPIDEPMNDDQQLTAKVASILAEREWLIAQADKNQPEPCLISFGQRYQDLVYTDGEPATIGQGYTSDSARNEQAIAQAGIYQSDLSAFRQAFPSTLSPSYPSVTPTPLPTNRRIQERFIAQAGHDIKVILPQALADLQASHDAMMDAAEDANAQALADANVAAGRLDTGMKQEFMDTVATMANHCSRYPTAPKPEITPTPSGPLSIRASDSVVHRTNMAGEFLAICQPGGAVFVNHQQAAAAYPIRLYPDEVVTTSRCDLYHYRRPAEP